MDARFRCMSVVVSALLFGSVADVAAAQRPARLFISVDMEGIGGIGTGQMTSSGGKDYELGRRLMTAEVNAVVAAIYERGPAEIVVNDSHGDMQNLLQLDLDPRVTYIQGSIKPHGMVEGLDSTFDGVIFLGYHTRAGTPGGFLAHTGSGAVKGLWINGRETGEGDMNAAYAASLGVPVILLSGDAALVDQLAYLNAEGVTTKRAVTPLSAALRHPEVVRELLAEGTRRALDGVTSARPMAIEEPVQVRLRFADVTTPQILEAIPGVRQVDGYTVEFRSETMSDAYRLIRLMYRFVSI
jgi:D-amino peptidase